MTIACLGITVLDRVFQVDELPHTGGKFVANNYFEIGGGPAATAAVAVSILGHSVDFIGRVGNDLIGKVMMDELATYQVNYANSKIIDNACSSFSTILVDKSGERMIINYQDNSLLKNADWLNDVDFSKYQAILCDVRWLAGAQFALEQVKKLKIPSVLDADVTPENIDELVSLADYVVFSEVGLKRFTNLEDVGQSLLKVQTKTQAQLFVTLGSKGCAWLEHGVVKYLQGFKVKVLDTTGAGDVFHGAFVVAIAEQMSCIDALKFSSAVAALKCTKLGGRAGIPNRLELNAFLAQQEL